MQWSDVIRQRWAFFVTREASLVSRGEPFAINTLFVFHAPRVAKPIDARA